jgi:uncharacterized protein (DUF2236 family)
MRRRSSLRPATSSPDALGDLAIGKIEGFFGPASMTWRVNREAAIYLGGLRALLMQIAHPKVAQGVADHSDYRRDPLARLRRTFDTVHALVFGTRDEALRAARRLQNVHSKVRGELEPPVAGHSKSYFANDPELLLWVHATLVDSSIFSYRTLVGPLEGADLDRYYSESRTFARLVGLGPKQVPASIEGFRRYFDRMIAGDELTVTPTALEVADSLLKGPPLLYLFRPSNYVLAAGMLPAPLRERFGLSWALPVRAAYGLGVSLVRGIVPRLPSQLRFVPSSRRAERRCLRHSRLAA